MRMAIHKSRQDELSTCIDGQPGGNTFHLAQHKVRALADKGDHVTPHGNHAVSEDTVLRIHRDNGSILDQGVKLIACFSACGCSADRK